MHCLSLARSLFLFLFLSLFSLPGPLPGPLELKTLNPVRHDHLTLKEKTDAHAEREQSASFAKTEAMSAAIFPLANGQTATAVPSTKF